MGRQTFEVTYILRDAEGNTERSEHLGFGEQEEIMKKIFEQAKKTNKQIRMLKIIDATKPATGK